MEMSPFPDPEKHLRNTCGNTLLGSNCSGIGMMLAQAPVVTASSLGGRELPGLPATPEPPLIETNEGPSEPLLADPHSLDGLPGFPPAPPAPPWPPGPPFPPTLE